MAGQDQSVNLSGMLGQIAETTGSMGDAFKPVMQQATKPRGEMDDPAHLQRLAQWASRNGDSAGATMYMQQARQLGAEQKEAALKLERETKAKAAGAATMQYRGALESGNAQDIAKAEEALIANAAALGYDPLERLNAAQSNVNAAQDQVFQKGERERQANERKFNQQFAGTMNTATDSDAIQQAVESAPPEMQPAAQRAANERLRYLEAKDARAAREAENMQTVDASITIPTELPEALQTQYNSELEQLEKDIESSKNPDGTWEPGVRRALQARRDRLATTVTDTLVRSELNKESESRTVARQWQNEYNKAVKAVPSKEMSNQIRKDLEADDSTRSDWVPYNEQRITEEQVIEEYRRQLTEALEATRPSGVAGASEEPTAQQFTSDEEARITAAVSQTGRSREEVIAKLYPNR